jgi:N-sulfoglucosamine sulfohydrolase
VFAFADDWGRYASAYEGQQQHDGGSGAAAGTSARPAAVAATSGISSLLSTPNFDWVAREGALFLNALVPAPSCTPCRSALLSGRYFWQTGLGAILDGARWDETIPTFPLELEKGGYHMGHTYKGWSPGRTANAPLGGKRTQYMSAGNNFSHFSHFVTANAPDLGVEAAKQLLYEETRQNFRAFLAARPAATSEEGVPPFCYWWGPSKFQHAPQLGARLRQAPVGPRA